MNTWQRIIVIVVSVCFILALQFGIVYAFVYGITWAFDLEFSVKYVIGGWLVWIVLRSIFKSETKVEVESKEERINREFDELLRERGWR